MALPSSTPTPTPGTPTPGKGSLNEEILSKVTTCSFVDMSSPDSKGHGVQRGRSHPCLRRKSNFVSLSLVKGILSGHGQIASACFPEHLKRTVFLVKDQVVLHKSPSSSLFMYLEKIFIQLQKVIKTQAPLDMSAKVEQLEYISKVSTRIPAMENSAFFFFLSVTEETLVANFPRSSW